jgi:flavin-dependent dehydrogenase
MPEKRADVAVIGGGLAGLAASIQLAKAGFTVYCFEPMTDFRRIVGESLDWSAPQLLEAIELRMDELVRSEVSTYKRHVILKLEDGSEAEYVPSPWLGRAPLNIELRTLHVDRLRLRHNLMRIAVAHGVIIVHDRVTGIERSGSTITAAQTALGQRVVAKWFIDASGSASSFLGREFKLSSIDYGPKKVAMWTHFKTSDWQEGTTLYADDSQGRYMTWIWEIPINPDTVSVGYVTTGAAVKEQRERSLSIEQIFKGQLHKFSRFRSLLQDSDLLKPSVTSFTCRVFNRVCGPNWIIVGEAASVPDPITGNGVTAALRHAAEAAKLISRFKHKRRISLSAQATYNWRVRHMSNFFNSLIEKLVYDSPIRDRMGLLSAGHAYTIPAWSINQLYSRIRPDGLISTVLFNSFLGLLRCTAWLFYRLCKLFPVAPCALPDSGS